MGAFSGEHHRFLLLRKPQIAYTSAGIPRSVWSRRHSTLSGRAVRAGLELAKAGPDLDRQGVRLSARVGIATGLVVVGEIGGGEPNAVVGETPNLAARLQAEAPPGAAGRQKHTEERSVFSQ
jgi:class 3 adenylate cyclase